MKLSSVLVAVMAFIPMTLVIAGVLGLTHPAQAQSTSSTDYDADDDGLIEVSSLSQLDAIRWDLDGNGSSTNSTAYDSAFPDAATSMGCPSTGCTGYELDADIDLDVFPYNYGTGWAPIGKLRAHFTATFEGNGNTIAGLSHNSEGSYIGLFGYVGRGGVIRNVRLTEVSVSGRTTIGGLAGQNYGTISGSSATVEVSRNATGPTIVGSDRFGGLVGINNGTITSSYATGSVRAQIGSAGGLVGVSIGTTTASYATVAVSGEGHVGGLVGINYGTTTASYATGAVSGGTPGDVGGLVGINYGTITANYAIGAVSGATSTSSDVGGLVGANNGTITASYWDTDTSGLSTSAGGQGKTTSELLSPTGYTGIYADWNVDLGGDGTGDDPWDFGNAAQYPALDYGGLSVSDQRSSGSGSQATSTPTATPTPTPTATPTRTATSTDYDADDDGLIEITSAAQLNAVRWDLNGDGTPASANAPDYSAAFPYAAAGMGCPQAGCTGYELTIDIDLDVAPYNSGAGWEPIGTFAIGGSFSATFEGNGNTISDLLINRSAADYVGLFGAVGINGTGTIRNVGLTGVNVAGSRSVGGLAGWSRGTISGSYAMGRVSGAGDQVGGLAGYNGGTGTVSGSYAAVTVSGSGNDVGGLVGHNEGTGSITASYAIGTASSTGDFVGGLVGANFSTINASYATGIASGRSHAGGLIGGDVRGTITASYWDTQTSSLSTSAGGVGKTTSELKSPTSSTGIYATWDDDVWDFGTSSQYPALKGLGLSVAQQRQSHPAAVSPPGAPTMGAVTAATGTLAVSWTAPSSDGGSAITAYDLRHIETSADETTDSNWTVEDDVWTTGGGTLQYTLTGLTGGTQYDLQMRAVNSGGDGPWSATATGTPTTAATTTATDYDADDDGLIEVDSLTQLDAIRYDLDGDGSPTSSTAYDAAFPNAATGMGCPSTGCAGYELTTNLDFDTNGDGRTDIAGDTYWNSGAGWQSIGTFNATFDGNGNIIGGLFINMIPGSSVGLFRRVSSAGTIRNVGLTGLDVTGGELVGGLVGENLGTITASYATGTVSDDNRISSKRVGGLVGENGGTITASYAIGAVSTDGFNVGGLVGENGGTITVSYAVGTVSGDFSVGGLVGQNNGTTTASYATGTVSGRSYVGGLVGQNAAYGRTPPGGSFILYGTGAIVASYATGMVSGESDVGGLVGSSYRGVGITSSYWNTETSGHSSSAGGEGKTTSELQSPTSNTGIYATWDSNTWDFGTSSQYPALKGLAVGVAKQRQSHPAAASVSSPGVPTIGAVTSATGTLAISWTAPSSDGGSAITAYDLRHIETSADETVDSNWTVVDDVWTTGGGTLLYTITGLTGGTHYDLQVRAVNSAGDGPWYATATGTPTTAATTTATDYDDDDDGLIEVDSLTQLDAIRYDLDGDGSPTNSTAYAAAFANAATGMGCPSTGCTGYELTTDLDFDTNGDGRTDIAGDTYWNGGSGWEPIGDFDVNVIFPQGLGATFDGGNHAISNLYINRPGTAYTGLFGHVDSDISEVGLISVSVRGGSSTGGLAGRNEGRIISSYVSGSVIGDDSVGGLVGDNRDQLITIQDSYFDGSVSGNNDVGGLIGITSSEIFKSYAAGSVLGNNNVGGLVGRQHVASIISSYAMGNVTGNSDVGGLVGQHNRGVIVKSFATGSVSGSNNVGGMSGSYVPGDVTDSYWDTGTSGQSSSAGGEGKTTSELQSPTSNTGIYATWDSNVWDFGTSSQYPALKGLPISVAEQRRLGAPQPPGAPSVSATTTGAALVRLGRAIPITATFSEPVNGFTESDVTVTSGDISNFSGSDGDTAYTFDVTPNAIGVVTVDIPSGAATDSDGESNTAAERLTLGLPYDDDHDGLISASEVLRAVADFFSDRLSAGHVLQIVALFFTSSN